MTRTRRRWMVRRLCDFWADWLAPLAMGYVVGADLSGLPLARTVMVGAVVILLGSALLHTGRAVAASRRLQRLQRRLRAERRAVRGRR